MSATIPQLQLFALVTAIEGDLRDIIREHLLAITELSALIDVETLQKSVDRLTRERGISGENIPPVEVLNYLVDHF
jgi:hypothetical protein